jgi:Glycerol-3-phosphate dehydrogenase
VNTVAVLGAGVLGATTLAVHLCGLGAEVRLWGNVREDLDAMIRDRENRKFLSGIALPDGVKVLPELEAALDGAGFIFYVVPSQAVREVGERVARAGSRGRAVCCAKGLELGSLKRMSEVLRECQPGHTPGHPHGAEPRGGGEPGHPHPRWWRPRRRRRRRGRCRCCARARPSGSTPTPTWRAASTPRR